MNSIEIIKISLTTAEFVIRSYLADLTDDEILLPPAPGANPIAWQLGHTILSEWRFTQALRPGVSPQLSEAFIARHGKDGANDPSPAGFLRLEQYLDLMAAQRKVTLESLESLSESDLDRPAPESVRSYAPTIGAAFILQPGHWFMHAGQMAALRRSLGKPVRI